MKSKNCEVCDADNGVEKVWLIAADGSVYSELMCYDCIKANASDDDVIYSSYEAAVADSPDLMGYGDEVDMELVV